MGDFFVFAGNHKYSDVDYLYGLFCEETDKKLPNGTKSMCADPTAPNLSQFLVAGKMPKHMAEHENS